MQDAFVRWMEVAGEEILAPDAFIRRVGTPSGLDQEPISAIACRR
jgi:hypothetical protein